MKQTPTRSAFEQLVSSAPAPAALVSAAPASAALVLAPRGARGVAFVAPHELGGYIGGVGRFIVSIAEACVAGEDGDDNALWLPALRAATLSRLLATVRTAQRHLAAAVGVGREADAGRGRGHRAQREGRRRAAVVKALVEGELRLRTLVLELERRGGTVRE